MNASTEACLARGSATGSLSVRTCAFNLAVPADSSNDCVIEKLEWTSTLERVDVAFFGRVSRCVLGDSRAPVSKPQKLGPFRNRRWRGTNEAEGPRCALLIRSASRCIRRGGRFRVRVSVFEPSFAWETDYLQICQNTSLWCLFQFSPLIFSTELSFL